MTSHNPLLAFLRTVPLFARVEPPEMIDLLRLLRPVDLRAGDVLFREGAPGKAMWILGGSTQVSLSVQPAGRARPVVLATLAAGDTVGEMALVDDGGRSATAVVTASGPAHQIDAMDFLVLREQSHSGAYKVMREVASLLCRRLRSATDRAVDFSGAAGSSSALGGGRPTTMEEVEEFAPFMKLPRVVLLALSQKLRALELAPGSVLFEQGERADAAYLLVRGGVEVSRGDSVLSTLAPGSVFGIVAALDAGARAATCTAVEKSLILRLSDADFDALFLAGNRFAYQLVDLVCRQLVTHLRETNRLIAAQPVDQQGGILPLSLEVELA